MPMGFIHVIVQIVRANQNAKRLHGTPIRLWMDAQSR